ncbi:hypothetical protein LWI28_009560 [Acer negundo]|uniref:Uncharacterized protein n=1 Tax=Acer negundo TaxID=4023 RepID=A0AAD5IU16_ACENE|nr:hypothetical protein LWI28_009560 [Acer negundo]
MGISDKGDIVHVDGDVNDVWSSKFPITNRGIKLPHLEQQLKNIKTTDDDFKITFCLYLLGTVLALAVEKYVDSRYLNVLGDVNNIRRKNWVSINEYVAPATPSDNLDKVEHNIPNDATLQMVLKEIQSFRKEIQQFHTEHTDLTYKVDRMEEKVDILHKKLNMEGQKVNDGFVPSKEQQTPTPKFDDDHAGVAKDFDFKFDDDHAPEHTFIPSLMDED